MKIIESKLEDIEPTEFDKYQELLRYSVETIFGGDPEVVDRYRAVIEECPEDEQLLVLHDEPLNVAATLTGNDMPTPDQVAQYLAHRDGT